MFSYNVLIHNKIERKKIFPFVFRAEIPIFAGKLEQYEL